MKLSAINVSTVFNDCLFSVDEDSSDMIKATSIQLNVGFCEERLKSHDDDIQSMINELPDSFKKDGGGGMSFLNMCVTKDGFQWGEHNNMDQLVALGIATGKMSYLMPRELWSSFPGGMPYLIVN